MKCKECPLSLLCMSDTLNLKSTDTYICSNCFRFFIRDAVKITGLNCFVCEKRSNYIKDRLRKHRNLCEKGSIVQNSIVRYERVLIDRDPVQSHRWLNIRLCETCDKANELRYNAFRNGYTITYKGAKRGR